MIGKPLDELRDQSAHITGAICAIGPLAAYPSIWTAALAGFALGMSREIGEERPPTTIEKLRRIFAVQKLDLFFWTIGGASAWLIFGV
jgi:hypothetical protein